MKTKSVLVVGLLGLLLSVLLSSQARAEEDEPYYMADVQATVNMPPRWSVLPQGWADWYFKGQSGDKAVQMRLFFTPFQLPPDTAVAQAWAKMHAERLDEVKAGEIEATRTELTTRFGRPCAEIDLAFRFDGDGPKGVYYAVAFPASGKVIHLATLAAARNEKRARKDLDFLLQNLEVEKEAVSLKGLDGKAVSPAAFQSSLPPGWRQPLKVELTALGELAGKTGQGRYDEEVCWTAIQPLPEGDPDFMLFCQVGLYLPKVDEHSWEGVEPQVQERFFGKSAVEVPHAERVQASNRMGFLYRPPAQSESVLMAVAPYDQGVLVAWGLAQKQRAQELETAMLATLASTRFTGPEGGHPPIGFAGWLTYSIKYRPTNPFFLGPVLFVLGLVGFVVIKLARYKPPTIDDY